MGNYILEVRYRLRAHNVKQFEEILTKQVIPLADELELKLLGVWKTFTGNVGEFVEHWEFDSLGEFEKDWPNLINDPRLQEIFQITGPMVEGETFVLLEPVRKQS